MKLEDGWAFPDGETHLQRWMATPTVRRIMNGRPAYQGAKQAVAMGLCKRRRVAVDVGAHIGLWSYNLAHEFERVEAFEPVQAHRDCFTWNVKLPNVNLHACALGEREGSVSIFTEPTSSGDSRVNGAGAIPLRTLDSFELHDVDFVKIDTEGYELLVLRGAEETLRRCRPVVIVEQKPGHAQKFGFGETDAVPYLESLGAMLRKQMSGDYLMSWD